MTPSLRRPAAGLLAVLLVCVAVAGAAGPVVASAGTTDAAGDAPSVGAASPVEASAAASTAENASASGTESASASAAARASYPDGLVFVETSVEPAQPTPDGNFTVGVGVDVDAESGESFVVRDVDVLNGTSPDDEQFNGLDPDERIYPGENRTYDVSVGLDEVGPRTLYVRLRLASSTGDWTTVTRPVAVDVRQPHPQVGLRTEPTIPGSSTNVTLDVSNGLDAPVRSVEVDLRPERTAIDDPRRVVPSVASGATRSFEFTATGETSGPERIVADVAYTYNGTRYAFTRTLRTRFTAPENPGNVSLTGIEVTENGDRLRVRGTASNVGGTAVSSVVVSALDGEGTSPAQSNADYFVGRVPASDLSSFSVAATLETNETVTVPLRVQYVVDGVRHEYTRTVTYTPDQPEPTPSSGGLPLSSPLLLGVGLFGVAVVGGAGWRWFGGRN